MSDNEQRRFFRIDSKIIVASRIIDETEKMTLSDQIMTGNIRDADPRRLYLRLENKFREEINAIPGKNKELLDLIEILNRKINLLSQGSSWMDSEGSLFDQAPIDVNISACGLCFDSNKPLEVGASCALELVLIPEHSYIIAVGAVVGVEKHSHSSENDKNKLPYRVSIDYETIHDDDIERLIAHIMRKESEMLKARRLAKKSS